MFGVFLGHAILTLRTACSRAFGGCAVRRVRRFNRLIGVTGKHFGIVVGLLFGRFVFDRSDFRAVRQKSVGFFIVIVQGLGHGGHEYLGFRRKIQRLVHAAVGRLSLDLGTFAQALGQIGRILRSVTFVQMLDHAIGQLRIDVIHRPLAEIHGEPVGEMFQQPDTFGVHAGTRQIHDFGDAVTTIRAGGLDIRQVHVGAYVHAQRVGDAVHHFTHAEGAGAGSQVQHADSYNHAGFGGDTGVHHRFFPIACNIFHVQRNGVGVEFTYSRCAFRFGRTFFLLFAHIPHYYSLPPPPAIVRRSNLPRIGQCLICCPIFGLYRWTTWRTIWTS